jgi:hypothetical protein
MEAAANAADTSVARTSSTEVGCFSYDLKYYTMHNLDKRIASPWRAAISSN